MSIVIDALRTCGQQRDDLFWLALPNVVAMSLLQAAALTVNDALGIRIADLAPAPGVEPPDNIGLFLLVLLALIAASAYFLVTFSVAWLRRILTPLETPTIGETLRWRPRHTRFLLHWIGFLLSASMLLLIIGAPLAAAGPLLAAIFAVGLVWLYGRLSLVFPAIAVDRPLNLSQSWQATKRRGHLVFGVIVGTSIAVLLPSMAVRFVASAIVQDTGSIIVRWLTMLVVEGVAITSLACLLSALAIVFRLCTSGGRTVAMV